MRFRFSFNPIKVLFLQAHLWGTRVASYPLSILSRFYFYTKAKQENKIPMLTFNPIKVLFLLIVTLKEPYAVIPFNPIKVLFLPVILLVTRGGILSFNPIKVLFLLGLGNETSLTSIGLSILSRFYFYNPADIISPGHLQLSILSRFYFYNISSLTLSFCTLFFQSYQGSIFTNWCSWKVFDFNAFNPIKVLFLQNKQFPQLYLDILSILSRFYFYWMSAGQRPENRCFQSYQGSIFTHFPGHRSIIRDTFNPIKVLFLHLLSNLQSWDLQAFNPIKVLFLLAQYIVVQDSLEALSILSRFYFYLLSLHRLRTALTLSILSRFYFYCLCC